jgi:phosphoglucan,water dikinase
MSEIVRIRIGNQTAFSALTPIRPFEYAVESGFDAFEWFPDKKESGAGWEESELDAETRRDIRNTALEHDIRQSVHVPWQVNPLQPEARERLFEHLEFAQDIGASLLNVHLCTDDGIAFYMQSIIPLVKRLARVGIKLSIENTPLTGPGNFNELFRRFCNLGSAYTACVGMCLDIGHANLCEATRNDYLKFIDLLDPQVPIIHVHMHENYGDYDSHLPIFTGPAGKDALGIEGITERLKRRSFSGCIILEQWPQPPTLLNEARNRLREMIEKSPLPPFKKGWNLRGLGGILPQMDDFANTIAKADQRYQSWREKLGWIHDLLTDDAFHLNTEHLIYLVIYLHFIGTGKISCSEDGRHHRPSHHAKMARRIHDRLSKITTSDNVFIIRKIYPWLPSYNSAFTRAEPLTRIRDIAHRNDIPKELKREIKHTLQNKLHRCAGPEDLATSAALLERITAPDADYSLAFVEEFKRFHAELKEFFNARSLEEQLEVIAKKGNAQGVALIRTFLEAKKMADTPEKQLTTFERLTRLRSHFEEEIKRSTSSEAQHLLLADIMLEDFSFVLLSQLINHFEASEDGMPWSPALYALALTVENLGLSGFGAEECQAVESELNFWRQRFEPQDIQQLIRLKSALDRCRRLAEVYCDKILALFPKKVERLGRALGVAEHAIKLFCEAYIRSHLVFQLSKLGTLFLKSIRADEALSRPVSPVAR